MQQFVYIKDTGVVCVCVRVWCVCVCVCVWVCALFLSGCLCLFEYMNVFMHFTYQCKIYNQSASVQTS